MKIFDIAVVGAGPGGLGACLRAASLGLKAALIERRISLSPLKRACSEGILYEEPYNGDAIRVNHEKGLIEFETSGLFLRYTGRTKKVPYFANISLQGNRMKIVRSDYKPIHLAFDKGRYLEENLDDAVEAGVSYFPNNTVTDISLINEGVLIQTDKETFKTRFLIAADGHNSMCARIAGFNRDRTFYGTLTASCWYVKGYEPQERAHVHLLEGKGGPSVICFCPRVNDDEYNIMISSFNLGYNYKEKFEHVQSGTVLSKYFNKKTQTVRELSCVLNLFSPLRDPCRDNIFVIGDAAWMGQTSNTHAALTGYKAVECIYEALRDKATGSDVYQSYRKWWEETYARYSKPPGINIFEELEGHEIDELFSYMPEEIEGSLSPQKGQKLLGEFFQKFLPEVQKKNPKLAEKVVSIQTRQPEEAWKQRRSCGFPVRTRSKV